MFNKVLFDMTIRTSFNAYNDIRIKKNIQNKWNNKTKNIVYFFTLYWL